MKDLTNEDLRYELKHSKNHFYIMVGICMFLFLVLAYLDNKCNDYENQIRNQHSKIELLERKK
jgi:hypothetical protein